MNIKLDENIPARLVEALANLGHNVDTVQVEGLTGKPDEVVWDATREARRFLVTQDLDFSDTRQFSPGTHDGILIVRLRNPGRSILVERIVEFFTDESIGDLHGAFVVLTDRKVRVRRKPAVP